MDIVGRERAAPPSTVFVSYSHTDSAWLERLQVQLKPFEREGLFHLWDDTKIDPGSLWRDEIKHALRSARVAVLLVSADFLASEFIASNELPPLLHAAKENGTRILPVIVSPCLYRETALKDFQAVNDTGKPLVDLKKGAREKVFVSVARAVRESLGYADEGPRLAQPSAAPRISSDGIARAAPATRRPTPLPGSVRPGVTKGLTIWGLVDEETLRRIEPLEKLPTPGHSVLQKCKLDGELCILKGSEAELCDIDGLQQLVTGGPRPRPSALPIIPPEMGTPRAFWTNDDYVWELQHWYPGRALADIVAAERQPITGPRLLAVVEALVKVLDVLNARGLVHRDINPGNILMLDGTSEIRIIDWTSCCRQSWPQKEVWTPGYTAPEQRVRRAVCASDWYSLGATCFALANGFTVEDRGSDVVAAGIGNIKLGSGEYRGWKEEEFFRALLANDPLSRPKPWESKRELFDIRRQSLGRASGRVNRRGIQEGIVPWLSSVIDRVLRR